MMNPITYEVIRNRLLAVTEEMRIALQSVSGSPRKRVSRRVRPLPIG